VTSGMARLDEGCSTSNSHSSSNSMLARIAMHVRWATGCSQGVPPGPWLVAQGRALDFQGNLQQLRFIRPAQQQRSALRLCGLHS
jgi:hypothetical protein